MLTRQSAVCTTSYLASLAAMVRVKISSIHNEMTRLIRSGTGQDRLPVMPDFGPIAYSRTCRPEASPSSHGPAKPIIVVIRYW